MALPSEQAPQGQVGFTPKGARRVAAAAERTERFDRARYNGTGPARTHRQVPKQRTGYVVRITDQPSLGDPDLFPALVIDFDGYSAGTLFWEDGEACWVVRCDGDTAALPTGTETTAIRAGVNYDDGLLIFVVGPRPAAGGTALNTQNTDGTQVDSTTTDLRFDKSSGVQVTQGSGGTVNQSIVSGIFATPSQNGTVSTLTQSFGGAKTFENAVTVWGTYTNTDSAGGPAITQTTTGGAVPIAFESFTSGFVATLGTATAEVGTTAGGSTCESYVEGSAAADLLGPDNPSYSLTAMYQPSAQKYASVMVTGGTNGSGTSVTIELIADEFNAIVGLRVPAADYWFYQPATAISGTDPVLTGRDLDFDANGLGPIVRTPAGTRRRIVVDNAGVVSSVLA